MALIQRFFFLSGRTKVYEVYGTPRNGQVPGCSFSLLSVLAEMNQGRSLAPYSIAEATEHGDATRPTSPRYRLRSPRGRELLDSVAY